MTSSIRSELVSRHGGRPYYPSPRGGAARRRRLKAPPLLALERVPERALDLSEVLGIVDLPALGVDHVERVDHLGSERLHLRRADVEVEVGESPRRPIQHPDRIGREHLDHRRRARDLGVEAGR